MTKIRALTILALMSASTLAGCSTESLETPGSTQEGIVRATSLGGQDQVVMIYTTVFDGQNGTISRRTCSGTYFAPRVVATAAHCLDADAELQQSVLQVLVYFGDDFVSDEAELVPFGDTFQVPPPGQPSHFAEADSFEQHPDWDRDLIYPDLGVVYLDRTLPFEPLPLARFRINKPWEGRTATISGWGGSEVTGPTTATGGRVQRTGQTTIVGSPTRADYHPEDPNPGMLQANIRNKIIKIDGRAPNSNACFGDSGGPLIVNRGGQDYVAGVEYFGGLYCEDYSLYTRVDSFLPFFDEAARKGGRAPIVPKLDCVSENADGTLTAFFGYDNDNGVSVEIPLGPDNSLPLDENGYRTTVFEPGEHHFVFGADFAPSQKLVYKLSPEHGRETTLRVTAKSKRCGAADQPAALCGQSCRGQLASGCTGLPSYGTCIDGCVGFYDIFSEPASCRPLLDEWTSCIANLSPSPENWMCFEESSPGAGDGFADSPACTPYVDSFFECAFGG